MKQVLRIIRGLFDRRTLVVSTVWLCIWLVVVAGFIISDSNKYVVCIVSAIGWTLGFFSYLDYRIAQNMVQQLDNEEDSDNDG